MGKSVCEGEENVANEMDYVAQNVANEMDYVAQNVANEIDYVAQMDALLEFLDQKYTIVTPRWVKDLKNRTYRKLSFLRIVLEVSNHQSVDESELEHFAGLARKVGRIISAHHLEEMDGKMAGKLRERLEIQLEHLYRWMYPPCGTNEEEGLTQLDALLEFLEEYSPHVINSQMKNLEKSTRLRELLALRAAVRVGQKKLLLSTLKSISSAFDLHKMNSYNMIYRLCKPLAVLMESWNSWVNNIQWQGQVPPRIYYPMADRLGFIDHLVENVERLVKSSKFDSISHLKGFLVRLQKMLQLSKSLIVQVSQLPHMEEDLDIQDLIRRVSNLAYEAEFIIDSHLVKRISDRSCTHGLLEVLGALEYYQSLLVRISHGDELHIPFVANSGIAKHSIASETVTEFGNRESIVREIINMSHQDELSIIPFVTNMKISEDNILRAIIRDDSVVDKYRFISWAQVSYYEETKRQVFLDLIWKFFQNMDGKGQDEIRQELRERTQGHIEIALSRLLCCHKALIILEAVSNINTINDIRKLFGDTRVGSTILVTTTSLQVANQCRYGCQKIFIERNLTLQSNTYGIGIVGFKIETEQMREFLKGGTKQLSLVSIVGMAGQGKTTLAMKMYNDVSIVKFFYTRAWCCVSQSYEKKKLLLELLGHVVQLPDTIYQKNDHDLAEMLYKNLKGRRYLIFLDDIWEINAWNDLRRCFPDDNNGSRIIFTTRIRELASWATTSRTKLQSLSLLSVDESWELLEKKLFQNGSCPPELLEIGREIAKNCRGLPLSVILIAGVLGKMKKEVHQWERVANSLSSQILGDMEAGSKTIIELSYRNLPDHLKPCFLYFGVSLDDTDIPARKLIQIWIAEGFIKHTNQNSLGDTAEGYLMDLISRCLVTVAQEKSKGGPKYCRIHDLLREYSLVKAREENFM